MLIEKADHKDFFKASFMSGKDTTKRCRKQMGANLALHLTAIPLRSKAAGELGLSSLENCANENEPVHIE